LGFLTNFPAVVCFYFSVVILCVTASAKDGHRGEQTGGDQSAEGV